MERREHDIFLEMLDNPNASFDTMIVAGLTPENTSLQSKDVYKSDQWVQNQFKNEQGQFDEDAFNKAYEVSAIYYNSLADRSYDEAMKTQVTFHRNNIWAPSDQIEKAPKFHEIQMFNPQEQITGFIQLGRTEDPKKSVDELAQSHRVLTNPTTAGNNLENAVWDDSPNDKFWGYFWDTLVLAQWDSDGTHIDPLSGQTVEHKKGDIRLDNEGNYFYEKLDGRNIYGRNVLNKMNVLTEDGSWWNQYDFFDSDDLEQKSIGGTVLKNLALVGTMFIPYVGPWITGISIATQLAGLGATLGKMLVGSDSPTLSAIEGWSQSVNRQNAKTQYAQENTWCWENFINLIGDVAGQLREQRTIFEYLPAGIKGTNIMTKEGYAAKLKSLEEANYKIANTKISQLIKDPKLAKNLQVRASELNQIAARNAQAEMDSFVKGYHKLGEILGRGYMTAVTVGNTYGEAKLAGASDLDATLLTIGYAAGEWALLSSELGKWIMPELKAGRQKTAAIAKALTQANEETQNIRKQFGVALQNIPKEGKKQYAKKLFNIGKNLARAEYSTGQKTLRATVGSGLSEGLEEVSEELLADFSKGCYNVVNWLSGDSVRMDAFGYSNGQFDLSNIIDRYGMSLIGGAIGGSVFNIANNYREASSLGNMNYQSAVQELVYMARNGKLDKFLSDVDKLQLFDKNLSATDYIEGETGVLPAPGTKTNNQDLYAKRAIRNQAKLIQSILDAHGASISDESFLDIQTLKDLRFSALYNSTTAGAYLNEYNTLSSQLVGLVNKLRNLTIESKDLNNDGTVSDREQRATRDQENNNQIVKTKKQIKEVQEKIDGLLSGERSYEFISTALFEMSETLNNTFSSLSFPKFAEKKFNRNYSELTESEIDSALKAFRIWKSGEGRDEVKSNAQLYMQIAEQASNLLTTQSNTYKNIPENVRRLNLAVSNIYQQLDNPDTFLYNNQTFENSSVNSLINNYAEIFADNQDWIGYLNNLKQDINKAETEQDRKKLVDQLIDFYKDSTKQLLLHDISQLTKQGFINSETKYQLNRIFKYLNNYLNNKIYKIQEQMDTDPSYTEGDQELVQLSNDIQNLRQVQQQINNLNNTPLEQNLNEFRQSLGKDSISILELQSKLNSIYEDVSNNIASFNLEEQTYKELRDAIFSLQLYKAAILGARTDAVDAENYYGYNATLNEVSRKVKGNFPKLAEIDSQTADLFINDINTTLNKLQFLKDLYEVNQSQKLTRQDRVSINKDILIYRRLHSLISVPPEDELQKWNGFLEFSNVIQSLHIHEELSKSNAKNVPLEQKQEYYKEQLRLEDSIYNFFQANQDKLNNTNELSKLISPSRLQLYTHADELLTENTQSIDDNSVVWWIASRAAVKASDFYYQYAQIIDPQATTPLAPIPTQELAVYLNYASIVNGNVFTQFYKAFRKSLTDDYKNNKERRSDILKLLGKTGIPTSDELAEYAVNFLSVPRYSNIILTEGTPGSGKTQSVFKQTVELLRKYHPTILENVYIAHGASTSSAEGLKTSLNLSKATTFDRNKLMKEINSQWKDYTIDPNTGKYIIPKTDFSVTTENEFRTSLSINQTSNPPSLILIDEISQFNSYDIDQIENYAKKYGITVLVAGDFDQSGVSGSHPITISGQKYEWEVALERTNFIRTPKLGVSMRTDNTIKTKNLQMVQAALHNGKVKDIDLKYYQDETGIYGDKTYIAEGGFINSLDVKEITKDINLLISTLKPNQKIGYVYDNEDSQLYKLLSSDAYSQYIDFKKGSTAQGLESQYYIIENSSEQIEYDDLRNIYTGISRAEQGSILISSQIKSSRVTNKIDEKLSTPLIRKYAKERKELLNSIITEHNPIQIVPRTTESITTINKTPSKGLEDGESSQQTTQPIVESPTIEQPIEQSAESIVEQPVEQNIVEYSTQQDSQQSSKEEEVARVTKELENIQTIEQLDELITRLPTEYPLLNSDPDFIAELNKVKQNLDEDKADKEPIIAPDINPYSDNIAPITNTDIITEGEYIEQLNSSNEITPFESSTIDDSEQIQVETLQHSFNTFETGILFDNESYPIISQWSDARIDSVNGLIKIDKLKGIGLRKEDSYVSQLGYLRSLLFNIQDKSVLEQRISQFLGLQNIYITFALKSSPRASEEKRKNKQEYVESSPSAFSKGISETTLFNGSNDTNSQRLHDKSIVAIIGTRENGNLLEMPLVALSSPFTLIKTQEDGKRVFGEMYDYYTKLYNEGRSTHDTSELIVKQFDGNRKYQQLVNLFKLFNFTFRGISYIKDPQWTLAKDLQLLGPQFVTTRGYYQSVQGYSYNNSKIPESEYITLEEFARNPELKVTDNVYISITGEINDGNGQSLKVAKAGHRFVLVSYDRDLNTDKKIVDYFIKQNFDLTVPPKVQLMYILPPKATIEQYVENLRKILSNEEREPIGQLTTSYKLLKILMQNQNFRQLLEQKTTNLVSKVDDAIRELDSLSNNSDRKNKLYEPQNWSDTGLSAKPTALSGLLDGVLMSVVYTRNTLGNLVGQHNKFILDQESLDLVKTILSNNGITGVYYNPRIPRDGQMVGQFNVLTGHQVNGKPYRINGKVDSYTFKGNIDWLVSQFLNELHPNSKGILQSAEYNSYNIIRNSSINSKQNSKRINLINYIKNKVQIDYTNRTDSENTIINDVINTVNSDKYNRVAFIYNGELVISNANDILLGDTLLLDSNSNQVTNIEQVSTIKVNDKSYLVEFDKVNKELILTPQNQEAIQQPSLSINEENFNNYIQDARIALESMFRYDPDYDTLFKSSNYQEFLQNLEEMDIIGKDRISDLQNILDTEVLTNSQKQIVEELINYENSMSEETTSCPIDIHIKI